MRKILLLLTIIAVSLNSFAQHTVQGIPYNNPRKLYSVEKLTPPLLTSDAPFTFDDIQNWTGEGENQAAVVIQFNTGKDTETTAMVFGYRWDGEKTGADMIVAIAESDPRFYILANYGGYGYSIGGMGWDADEDGDNYLVKDDVRYDLVNGKYECSSEYDYDNFTAGDTDDFWAGGWFNGYWSYWTSTSGPENFGYASTGASGRTLTNGCWDGWNFYAGMSSYSWLPFAAAPSLIPEGATTEFKVNGIYYTLGSYQNKTVYVSAAKEMEDEILTAYTGEITIPASFTFDEVEYTVVGIDKNAFENTTITTVTLPATIAEIKDEAFKNSSLSAIDLQYVEKIGKYAFTGCRQLKNVALSSSVKKISEGTFSDSGITSISLENVTTIDASAFANCASLATVSGWSSLEAIGASAFSGCTAIKEVVFETSLQSIGESAFAGCSDLTNIEAKNIVPLAITENVFGETTYVTATLTVPYDYKIVYANSVGWRNFVNIAEETIDVNVGDYFYKNSVAYIVLSNDESSKTVKVTHFASEENNSAIATANNQGYVGDITIPGKVSYQKINFDVVEIEASALRGAKQMTSITFDNSNITVLPDNALYQCTGVVSIVLPENLETIGEYSLYQCSLLENITIPESVRTIGSRAFYGCSKLLSISLSDNVESIGAYAFNGCSSITEFEFPKNITDIPNYLFSNCTSLAEIKFGPNVVTIGNYAFNGCGSLTSVVLPAGLISIGQNGFANCGLTSISFPASLTTLGNNSFSGCKQLTSVIVPETVTSIGTSLFKDCTGLTSVELHTTLTSLSNYMFSGCTGLSTFSFPAGLTSIGDYTFFKCSGIESLEIPENVTSIGQYAFSDCSSLTSIKLPSTLKKINARTFQNCSKLASVDLPETVTEIGAYAFSGCSELSSIELPAGLISVGNYMFQNCKKLTSVKLPEKVDKVAQYMFSGCTALESVQLPESVQHIYGRAFADCTSLTSIKLPSNLQTIDQRAFLNCGLTSLEIPATLNKFGYYAFYGCSGLVLYMCNPVPFQSNQSNALNLGVDEYPQLYVPYASADEYSADSKFGVCDIMTVCPEITFDVQENTCGGTIEETNISVPVLLSYAEDYQGLGNFVEANNSSLKTAATVRLKYRESMGDSQLEYTTIVAEEIEGRYNARLNDLKAQTMYECFWEYELEGLDNTIVSDMIYFSTTMTGLNDVELGESANEKVEYYTLHGVKVENSNLANGIYIRKVGNKAEKIIINN